jgi:hypothetical protein
MFRTHIIIKLNLVARWEMKIWLKSSMKNKALNIAVLLTFWFIISLFFTLGFFAIVLSVKELIFGFKPGLFPFLYILIGTFILHNTYEKLKKLNLKYEMRRDRWLKTYFRSHKWPLTVSIIITAILLYTYYNVFFLKFGFIANLALFFPAFVLENLIFIVKVFLKSFAMGGLAEIYKILIPIAEFYYIYSIVGFIYKISKKWFKKSYFYH